MVSRGRACQPLDCELDCKPGPINIRDSSRLVLVEARAGDGAADRNSTAAISMQIRSTKETEM